MKIDEAIKLLQNNGYLVTEYYSANENTDTNGIIAYVRSVLDEFPEKGELEFNSSGALDDAWEYLKSLGYSLKYTSDLDDYENLNHYIEYKLENNE